MDCPIDSLPDGLLGHIMTLTGREDRRSLVLVSRRWQRVFLAEPGLWRAFTMRAHRSSDTAEEQARRLERQVALLRSMAPHVVRFRWEEHTDKWRSAAAACLRHCLAALSRDQLVELQLSGPCVSLAGAGAAAALPQLSGRVTNLALGACSLQPALATLAALGSHLCSLQLSIDSLAYSLFDSIVQLPQLTALRIEAYVWPDLRTLTRLSHLQQLVLRDLRATSQCRMHPPLPASFPAGLQRFSYHSKYRTFEVAGCSLSTFRLWQGSTAGFSPDEGAAQELPLPTLALGFHSSSPPLPQLLSSLQPAGAAPRRFERIELSGTLPHQLAVAGCSTQLEQLAELSLSGMWAALGGTTLQQVVAALLQRASRLRSLAIHSEAGDATLGAVPACLASYHGLTSLALSGQGLQELPTGEYLSGLQSLDLRHNEFARMPAALSYATALTTLALDGNKQLALDEANVWVLLDLRLLRQLSTHGINIAAANQYMLRLLRWRLPHLRLLPLPAEAAAN